MLVPHMTMEEIIREVNKDYPILKRKMVYHSQEIRQKICRHILPRDFEMFFDYTSKYKNHWLYKINCSKKESEYIAILIYHNGRGHVGIEVGDDGSIIYHTGHFFLRYNERLNLGLCAFNDIVKAFMKENFAYQFQTIDCIAPGVHTFFGRIQTGVIMGTVYKRLHFAKINTFLPTAVLSPNQQAHLEHLRREMAKYKGTEFDVF
ncbi:MAG: hypothetical protein WCL06_09590 [Bacteroidota bacterium]